MAGDSQNFENGEIRVHEVGNVIAEHDKTLRQMMYMIKNPDDPDWINNEFYVADEARNLGLNLRQMRELVLREIDRIKADPFGKTSLDDHLKRDEETIEAVKQLRTVNRLSDEVQKMITVPIAIKGNGLPPKGEDSTTTDSLHKVGKEDLMDQYLFMRELQIASEEKMTPEQLDAVHFAKVYGAMAIEDEQYLIMERVVNASQTPSTGGEWMNVLGMPESLILDSSSDLFNVFPQLKSKASPGTDSGPILLPSIVLQEELEKLVGIKFRDLAGRNILQYHDGDKTKYVIIDPRRPREELA